MYHFLTQPNRWIRQAALGCLLALTAANFVRAVWQPILDAVFPITPASLELQPALIELRDLKTNEVRELTFTVFNRSLRSIDLAAPETGCGCIALDAQPLTLLPDSSHRFRFSFRAPSSPQTFSRVIRIRPRHQTNVDWTCVLKGEVQAKVWSQPAVVSVDFSEHVIPKCELAIHHEQNVELGSIQATGPGITATPGRAGQGVQMVEVSVCPELLDESDRGTEYVEIHDSAGQLVLRVPTQWRRRRVSHTGD